MKNILLTPKKKDNIKQKVELHICIDAAGGNAKMNTLEHKPEPLGECLEEHLKAPSPIYDHLFRTGHSTSVENFKIVGREGYNPAGPESSRMYVHLNMIINV